MKFIEFQKLNYEYERLQKKLIDLKQANIDTKYFDSLLEQEARLIEHNQRIRDVEVAIKKLEETEI